MAKETELNEFEYTILDVYETEGILCVEVEHEYGKQKIGLNLDAKYLGNDGQPKWKKEVEEKLKKKYGHRNTDKSLKTQRLFNDEIGKKHKIKTDD